MTQRVLFDVLQIVGTSAWNGLLLLQKLFKEETFEESKHIFYAFIRIYTCVRLCVKTKTREI